MSSVEAQQKLVREADQAQKELLARKIRGARRIPVFVQEGSVVNPDDMPPEYVLIYIKNAQLGPIFGPALF